MCHSSHTIESHTVASLFHMMDFAVILSGIKACSTRSNLNRWVHYWELPSFTAMCMCAPDWNSYTEVNYFLSWIVLNFSFHTRMCHTYRWTMTSCKEKTLLPHPVNKWKLLRTHFFTFWNTVSICGDYHSHFTCPWAKDVLPLMRNLGLTLFSQRGRYSRSCREDNSRFLYRTCLQLWRVFGQKTRKKNSENRRRSIRYLQVEPCNLNTLLYLRVISANECNHSRTHVKDEARNDPQEIKLVRVATRKWLSGDAGCMRRGNTIFKFVSVGELCFVVSRCQHTSRMKKRRVREILITRLLNFILLK